MKNKETEANPFADSTVNFDATLQEHLAQLRAKYASQEEALAREREELKARTRDGIEAATRMRLAVKALRAAVGAQPDEMRRARATFAAEMDKANAEFDRLKAEAASLEAQIRNAQDERDDWAQRYTQAQARLVAAAEKTHQLEAQLFEAQNGTQALGVNEERARLADTLAESVRALRERVKGAEQRAAQCAADLKEAQEARWTLETRALAAESEALRMRRIAELAGTDLETLRGQVAAGRERLKNVTAEAETLRAKATNLKQVNAKLGSETKVELELTEQRIAHQSERRAQLEAELERVQQSTRGFREGAAENEQTIGELGQEEADNEPGWAQTRSSTVDVRTDLKMSLQRRARVEDERAGLAEAHGDAERTAAMLEADNQLLEEELAIKVNLTEIRLEEFEALKETNEKLAETIKALTSRFGTLGKAGNRFSRRGGDLTVHAEIAEAATHVVRDNPPSSIELTGGETPPPRHMPSTSPRAARAPRESSRRPPSVLSSTPSIRRGAASPSRSLSVQGRPLFAPAKGFE